MKHNLVVISASILLLSCTAQQTIVNTIPQQKTAPTIEAKKEQQFLKRKVAIARFSNETLYAKGVFYDKANDPLGKQAVDILTTKLTASNKFILLERQDLDKIESELQLAGNQGVQKVGADFLIIGSITEFGRKNIGDVGVFSSSKKQVVQAGVSVRLVDVSTGQVIYSEEAKGEAETTSATVLGLGERTDYDATLNDKAISVAISKLVENIINNCMEKEWKSFFLTYDENGIIISGGAAQGIKVGDLFQVMEKGKSVKNPQSGMLMELPGKVVGKIKIEFTGGETPQNEFSIVSFVEGDINKQDLNKFYIKEIKK